MIVVVFCWLIGNAAIYSVRLAVAIAFKTPSKMVSFSSDQVVVISANVVFTCAIRSR